MFQSTVGFVHRLWIAPPLGELWKWISSTVAIVKSLFSLKGEVSDQ